MDPATVPIFNPDSVYGDSAGYDLETLSSNGVWSWFNDPHIIHRNHAGVNWLHVGSIATNGLVKVTNKNLDTGAITETQLADIDYDDHNVPALLTMPDGTLLATYSNHLNSGFWYRQTTDPADPTSWGTEQQRTAAQLGVTHTTYPIPIRFASNDRLYVFFRADTQDRRFVYSDDDGANWSATFPFIVEPSERPYTNSEYDSVGDRLDIIYTEGHPRDVDTSMYHITFEGNGDIRHTDGTLIKNIISAGAHTPNLGTRIYGYMPNKGRTWGWDICRDPADNTKLHAAFARYEHDDQDQHRYCYAYWDGTFWSVNDDVTADLFPGVSAGLSIYGTVPTTEPHYAGGVNLKRTDPTVMFMSRMKGDTAKWEVEKWGPGVPVEDRYATEVLRDVPTAYYRLGEPSGTLADDSAAGGLHDGTYVNTPTLDVPGALAVGDDGGVQFASASTEQVTLTTLGLMGSSLLTATFEFWIKTTVTGQRGVFGTVQTGTSMIVACNINTTGDNAVEAGSLAFMMRGTTSAQTLGRVQSSGVNDGAWHHVAIQVTSSTTFDIWIDGVKRTVAYIGQGAVTAPTNFEFPMTLGARNLRGVFDRHFDGSLDEVAFYEYQIHENRIRHHAALGRGLIKKFTTRTELTTRSTVKNVRPVAPRYPQVLTTTDAPEVVWMSGTYTGFTSFSMAVVTPTKPRTRSEAAFEGTGTIESGTTPADLPLGPAAATTTAALAVSAATQVPLAASAAQSTSTLAVGATTQVPLASSPAQSAATLAISAATQVPLAASAAVATTALAVKAQTTLPVATSAAASAATLALSAPTAVALAQSTASSTATIALTAQTGVALSTSPAISAATLSLRATTQIPLAGSAAVSSATLTVSTPSTTGELPLGSATAQSAATLALRAPTMVVLGPLGAGLSGSLGLSATTRVLLDASVAFATPSLVVSTLIPLPLATSSATSAATAVITLYTPLPLNPAVGLSAATLDVTQALFRAPRTNRPTGLVLNG